MPSAHTDCDFVEEGFCPYINMLRHTDTRNGRHL